MKGSAFVEYCRAGVTELAVADRVAIPWLGYACGSREYCLSGRETLCESQINTGYGMDGGHAEYCVAYAKYVVRVPDGVSSVEAAPLTCAGVTSYKAVKVAHQMQGGFLGRQVNVGTVRPDEVWISP